MTGTVEDKVALISGIARGQGRSHAQKLAEEGAHIIGFDLCEQIESVEYPMATDEDLRETVLSVEKTGRTIITAKADVRDFDAVKAFVDRAVGELGGLDIIVANAGIMPITGPQRWSHQAYRDGIDVMLNGVFNTVMAGIDHLLAHDRGGSIVITSSMAGLKGIGDGAAGCLGYVAAKHGVVGLMRAWAHTLGHKSIRVNTIHPTGVNSPMVMNEAFMRFVGEFPDVAAEMQNTLPVPLIECEDVSNALLFLCSDAGRYVTGQTLGVDAGFMVR